MYSDLFESKWCSSDVLRSMPSAEVGLVRSSVLGKTRRALREALQETFKDDNPAPVFEDFNRPYEMDVFGYGKAGKVRSRSPQWIGVSWFILEATQFRNLSISCFRAFARMHRVIGSNCLRRMLPVLLIGADAHTEIDCSGKPCPENMPESPVEVSAAADALNILTCSVGDNRDASQLYDFFHALKEGRVLSC